MAYLSGKLYFFLTSVFLHQPEEDPVPAICEILLVKEYGIQQTCHKRKSSAIHWHLFVGGKYPPEMVAKVVPQLGIAFSG